MVFVNPAPAVQEPLANATIKVLEKIGREIACYAGSQTGRLRRRGTSRAACDGRSKKAQTKCRQQSAHLAVGPSPRRDDRMRMASPTTLPLDRERRQALCQIGRDGGPPAIVGEDRVQAPQIRHRPDRTDRRAPP